MLTRGIGFQALFLRSLFVTSWVVVIVLQEAVVTRTLAEEEGFEEGILRTFVPHTDRGADLGRNLDDKDNYENNYNYRRGIYDNYEHFVHNKPTYTVVAPRLVRPSTVYQLVVGVLSGHSPLTVTAHMTSPDTALVPAHTVISPGETRDLRIQVPPVSGGSRFYTLVVEGRRDKALVFRNSTQVVATPSFLVILIHLSRPCFTGGQHVGVRVILLTTEMKPYQEPVDVYLLDPDGNAVKRWVSRTPHVGVVSLGFEMPELPKSGWWRMRVVAEDQNEEKKFLVHKVYQPLYEVIVEMPSYAFTEDEEIQGTLTGSYGSDKPVYGNASLTLYVKQPWSLPDSEFREVSTQHFHYVDEAQDFSFPMASLLNHVQFLEGAEVKVEAKFNDVFSWIKANGRNRMRIKRSGVQVEVVGGGPFVFRPGMAFSGTIAVRYVDGAPLEKIRLSAASVVIRPSVHTTSKSAIKLPQILIPTTLVDHKMREESLHALQVKQKDILWDEGSANKEKKDKGSWSFQDMSWPQRELQELLQNYTKEHYYAEFRDKGIFRFRIDTPEDATSLSFSVVYSDPDFMASTTAYAYAHSSHKSRFLQVTSSTKEAKIGEFAIFHIRTNFHVEKFVYLILSKGEMLHSSTEVTHGDDVVTLSVSVSSAMAPRFTFLAYITTTEGQVISDSMSMPVTVFDNMEVTMVTNQHKDHSKKTVELVVGAPSGSFYALTCQRAANYVRQHPNSLTKGRILDYMIQKDPSTRSFHGVMHMSREGEYADELLAFPAPSHGLDVLETFHDASLILLTDATVHQMPGKDRRCEAREGKMECGDGTCYLPHQLCDGFPHCLNQADELGCKRMYQDFPLSHHEQEDPFELSSDALFRLLRDGLILDMFDKDDGDWCNSEIWIGHHGQEELEREIAKTADDWVLEGYAIHENYGLSFTQQPIIFTGDPPFYILAEGPSVCRRGEQISIRVIVHNLLEVSIQAVLVLQNSPDYRFIHVETGGKVGHYKPRISSGQHQHLLMIPGGGKKEVVLPLAVMRQAGLMEVTVEAVSQLRKDSETLEIEVKPEGVPVRKHTSLLLDLSTRALVYEFLDVPIDESPVIPSSILRRFLYGSPAAKISVAGDVFGPILEGISVDHTQVFQGRHLRSTDGVAFNFGATIWTLHYLRLTNQLDMTKARKTFEYLAVQLAGLLRRFTDGGFSMWTFTPPSVWVSAKVANLLLAAQHEDWENFLYIDPGIIRKVVKFLLKYQMLDGGFSDEGEVTLDSKVKKTSHASSVPLTALVTVVLHNSITSLQGPTRIDAVHARERSKKFLERKLLLLNDCYHLALTTYALLMTKSSVADTAVAMLDEHKWSVGDKTYWSRTPITTHVRRQESNQRAFLLPREPEQWDSHAVETTSYALLVYLMKEGITPKTEQIMRWLNAVRDWDCAFISTADTVVAMQALAEYALRARLRDVTDMECTLDVTAQPAHPFHVTISNASTSIYHTFELDSVWGHVNLLAKGSGQAIAQLEVSWGVDVLRFIEQPHKKYFDLSVRETYHQFRNKSVITTTVCARWKATEDGPTSHAAMIELETPTGYVFFQPLAESAVSAIQQNGSFPQLRNVHTTDTRIFWQFEYIPSKKKQCFSYDIQRWYPAANLTAVRSATIMELFAPEHFEMVMINATPLSQLDICEVCGSYQCPYCPVYSGASSHQTVGLSVSLFGSCFTFLLLHLLQMPYNKRYL